MIGIAIAMIWFTGLLICGILYPKFDPKNHHDDDTRLLVCLFWPAFLIYHTLAYCLDFIIRMMIEGIRLLGKIGAKK